MNNNPKPPTTSDIATSWCNRKANIYLSYVHLGLSFTSRINQTHVDKSLAGLNEDSSMAHCIFYCIYVCVFFVFFCGQAAAGVKILRMFLLTVTSYTAKRKLLVAQETDRASCLFRMKSRHHVRGSQWKAVHRCGHDFSQVQEGNPESGRDGENICLSLKLFVFSVGKRSSHKGGTDSLQ